MTAIEYSIEIEAPASVVFNWFIHLSENYKDWHPSHVKAEWIEGYPMEIGSVLYTEEFLHGSLHEMRGRLTKIEENKLIEFSYMLPTSLVCKGGSFRVEEKCNNCVFTASLSVRMGRLISRLLGARAEALKQHMKEEGENLKRLLET